MDIITPIAKMRKQSLREINMSPEVMQLGISKVKLLESLLAHVAPLHELEKKSPLPSDIWFGDSQLTPLSKYLPIGKNLLPRPPNFLSGM